MSYFIFPLYNVTRPQETGSCKRNDKLLQRIRDKTENLVWSISSIGWGSVCTLGSGSSAPLAWVLCALPRLVNQLYWLWFCVHSRVWSISSIDWGSVCTPGSGPSALLAGVLCTISGLVHQLYWLGFCVHSRVWSISTIG